MSRVIFGISTGFLSEAVLSLRQKLGYSQERLARELGCSTGAVRQWESGLRRPSLAAVAQLAILAPDEETRALFASESGIRNLESRLAPQPRQGVKSQISNSKSSARIPAPGDDPEAVRYYNDAHVGLELLYDSAANHPGAKEELRAEAERLLQKGARWRDAKYRKMK